MTGLLGTYAFTPPSACVLQPADQKRFCLLGPGGSNGGAVLEVAQERMTPAEASSRSKDDWEIWMVAFQTMNDTLQGIAVVSGRHVAEDAFAARIGAEKCVALYSHLRAASVPDFDDAWITCVFVDRDSGKVDLVGVDYTEFRQDPGRENRGFAGRAAPVLHSLRRVTVA